MKRAIPSKVQPVDARENDNELAAEPSKQTASGSSRVRTSATAIGLAISMGAIASMLPKIGDSVVAAEPPTPGEPSTMQPGPIHGAVNSLNLEDELAKPVAAPATPGAMKVQKGLHWESSRDREVEIAPIANTHSIKSDAAPQGGQVLRIPSVNSIRSEVKGGHNVATLPAQKRYVESEATFGPTQVVPTSTPARSSDARSTEVLSGVSEEQLQGETNQVFNPLKPQENHLGNDRVELENQGSAVVSKSGTEALRTGKDFSNSALPTTVTKVPEAPLLVVPTEPVKVGDREPVTSAVTPSGLGTVEIESSLKVPTPVSTVYTVQNGDTLDQIASATGVSVAELIEINQISDPHYLKVNQSLKIPQIRSNSSSNDSPASISESNLVGTAPGGEVTLPLHGDVSDSTLTKTTISSFRNSELPTSAKFNNTPLTPFSAGAASLSSISQQGQIVGSGGVGQESLAPVVDLQGLGNSPAIASLEPGTINLISHRSDTRKAMSESIPQVSGLDSQSKTVKPAYSANPYADRLRAEITRLREEYRTERNTTNGADSNAVAVQQQVEAMETSRSEGTQPINPEFNPNQYAQAVQNEMSQPQARQWAEQMQRQRQENSPALSPAGVVEASPSSAPKQPLVATAPIGADAYDPLSNPSLGRMVSPELPPLSGPDTYLPAGSMPSNGMIWPAKGVLTSGYGWRWGRMHKGIDIAGPVGTPIVAADAGVVTYAQWNDGGYGYLVEVTHANGSQTLYGHNSRILVQEGQHVAQGEQISEMGSTGFSTGPHLHFEIHPNGQGAVNPLAFLPTTDDSTAYR